MRFFLFAFCFLAFGSLNAQYQIGSESKTSSIPNETNLEYLNGIEDSRTIFVYKDSDEDQLDELLANGWIKGRKLESRRKADT